MRVRPSLLRKESSRSSCATCRLLSAEKFRASIPFAAVVACVLSSAGSCIYLKLASVSVAARAVSAHQAARVQVRFESVSMGFLERTSAPASGLVLA